MYGIPPQQLNIPAKDNTWENVESVDNAFKVKSEWMSVFMAKIISNQNPDPNSLEWHGFQQTVPWENITVSSLVDALVDHSVKVTQVSRDFMLQNPEKQVPPNPKLYPGKMDHSSCVAFRVGNPFSLKL